MSYNVKNYTEQNGEVTHIGGTLVIEEGATVTGDGLSPTYTLPTASASTKGGVKVGDGLTISSEKLAVDAAANVAALGESAELADVITAVNGILTALKAKKLMAADA